MSCTRSCNSNSVEVQRRFPHFHLTWGGVGKTGWTNKFKGADWHIQPEASVRHHPPTTKMYIGVLLLLLCTQASGISMDVAAGVEQCIFFDVALVMNSNQKRQQDIFGSFQVASGGFLDIDLKVQTPTGKVMYTAERKTTDRFTLVAEDEGEWSACFSNKMSTLTSKVVSFNFRTGDGYGDGYGQGGGDGSQDPKDIATKKAVGPIKQNILKFASELVDVREIQNYANVRERAHRDSKFKMFSFVVHGG